MTLPHVALAAALDRRLRPLDLVTYIFLHSQLDIKDFRPVKLTWLAKKIHRARNNASASLRRLCRFGYLEAGPYLGGLRTYRVTLSPPDPDAEQRQEPRIGGTI